MVVNSSSSKKNTSQIVHINDTFFNSKATEVIYKRLELLLIGFASVLITFLWVGVFSTVFQNKQIRLSFLGENVVAEFVREGFSSSQSVAKGAVQVTSLAQQTIIYQFTALYESSCLMQGTCNGMVSFASDKALGVLASFQGLADHSHRVVALAADIFSFRFFDAGRSASSFFVPVPVYASSVMGEKTVSVDVIFQKGIYSYFRSIDTLTFGAVSIVNSDLIDGDK